MNCLVENQRMEDKAATRNFSFYCLIKPEFSHVFKEVKTKRKILKQSWTKNL